MFYYYGRKKRLAKLYPNPEHPHIIEPFAGSGDAGTGYRWGSKQLDYESLGVWVKSRKGQVICCENPEATWLPFRQLTVQKASAGKRNLEGIFP